MTLVLVIEDDAAILRGLTDNLEAESYEVLTARDGQEGYRLIAECDPDLVILDLMLPKQSGHEVCRKVREEGFTVPILILTARSEETDLLLGLDRGADDYMTKPFSLTELLARVRALLRRAERLTVVPERLSFDDVTVDFLSHEVTKAGEPVRLSRKEMGTLRLLAARPGEVVTRQELLKEVWRYKRFITTRTVDNHIASLRAKLEDEPGTPRRLLTVHGVGYKLVV